MQISRSGASRNFGVYSTEFVVRRAEFDPDTGMTTLNADGVSDFYGYCHHDWRIELNIDELVELADRAHWRGESRATGIRGWARRLRHSMARWCLVRAVRVARALVQPDGSEEARVLRLVDAA